MRVRPSTGPLPAADAEFDLVLNRHGSCAAGELARVLRPGGMLLTQQVGSDDCAAVNTALGAPPAYPPGSWDAAGAGAALTAAGFTLLDVREERPEVTFADVGALVFQLRMVTWQVPGFTVEGYDEALRRPARPRPRRRAGAPLPDPREAVIGLPPENEGVNGRLGRAWRRREAPASSRGCRHER